ncbi:urokinase plasminogen activator surface receptor-like [Perca fluviatilis]|uniref:urokinase plasminogen activator surface receptor-like n=1 Tax=Perca fluviatilis TaxID=8168 RepID=UPI0019644CDE|nr:urokinase plasminogen activator surface receptor-like [Perca fluviatilis]XP_039676604.1 urokinase plasminogen activator surface receptor-like [Perca fluviatilis]
MYLLALMFGILLLPEASPLRCYVCIPDGSGTCIQTSHECRKGLRCAAMRLVRYQGGSKVHEENSKGCAVAEDCGEYSVNFGISQTKVNMKCCTSDLCNTQPAPEPSKSKPNGKQCYWCDSQRCNNTLNCEGNEDNCISATETQGEHSVTVKGCVSKHLCTTRDKSWARKLTYSCCKGNLCNGASNHGAGLVLLAAPLLSFLGTSY